MESQSSQLSVYTRAILSTASLGSSLWVEAGSGSALVTLLNDSVNLSSSSSFVRRTRRAVRSSRLVLPLDILALHIPRYLRFEQELSGMIYVCGGRCSKVLEPHHYLATAEMYDPFRSEWVQLPNMSTRRVGAASVELNGLLYVVGGYCLHPDKPLASCEAFDPRTGRWMQVADMKQARFGHAIAAVGDRFLYVVGGDCRRTLVTAIERYDSLTDMWEVVAQLPTPVAGGRMLESGGLLYLVGGDVGSQPLSFTNKVRVFDPNTLNWETLPVTLERGRSACAVCWAGENEIAVIGGYAADEDSFFELASGEVVEVNTKTRRSLPNLTEARAGCRAVNFDGKIFVVGGESPGIKSEGVAGLLAGLGGGEGSAARALLVNALRGRLLGGLPPPTTANDAPDPAELVQAILSAATTANSPGTSGRVLHSSTLVFNTKTWKWETPLPLMAQPRTAAAVCVGKGFPRSYGPLWGSELKHAPFFQGYEAMRE